LSASIPHSSNTPATNRRADATSPGSSSKLFSWRCVTVFQTYPISSASNATATAIEAPPRSRRDQVMGGPAWQSRRTPAGNEGLARSVERSEHERGEGLRMGTNQR
jgi:hypothetical protein